MPSFYAVEVAMLGYFIGGMLVGYGITGLAQAAYRSWACRRGQRRG